MNKLKYILAMSNTRNSPFAKKEVNELDALKDIIECKIADVQIEELEVIDHVSEDNIFEPSEMYAYREKILNRVAFNGLSNSGRIIDELLMDSEVIICDEYASFELVIESITGAFTYRGMKAQEGARHWAERAAKDLCMATLIAAKVGGKGIQNVYNDLVGTAAYKNFYKNWVTFAEFMERLLIGSVPEKNKAGHHALFGPTPEEATVEQFIYKQDFILRAAPKFKISRVCGLTMIGFHKKMYVLDQSSLTQVYQCARFWSNYATYITNYRISGDNNREDLHEATAHIISWLKNCRTSTLPKIPRHMKVTHNIMMNEFHNKSERESLGSASRISTMMEELKDHVVNEMSFYTLLTSQKISDRAKMDLSYIFHGLPAPDCDPNVLIKTLHRKTHESNEVKDNTFKEFMNYSKAYDLTNIITKYRGSCKEAIKSEPGYKYEDTTWYKSCMKGESMLPPESDMGRAWVSNLFEHENHMEFWYLEAADATHVVSDFNVYSTMSALLRLPKEMHNELLYTLRYGSKLHKKYTPSEVRTKLSEKINFCDWVAVLAAKSENTKYGEKVRETLSASDIAREATSDMDRCANKVAKLGHASTMRAPVTRINKKFKEITELTKIGNTKRTVIMSLDVSGWSPNANRKRMFEHIRYVLSLTKHGNDIDYEYYWDKFQLLIAKRGSFMTAPGDSGMYQGFTGTLDTVLHQHMLFFAVRKAKSNGILKFNESAYGMCLIDDGVIALELDSSRSDDDIDRTSNLFSDHVIKVYNELGYKIDKIKTLVSNTKFVYLNRFFAEGNEVTMPMKVMCKIDRELNRKFSTIRDQIQSVFGSASSSVIKGGDPVLGYYMAASRSLQLVNMTHAGVIKLGAEALYSLCVAPKNVGGLNFPTMHEWVSGSITDHYLHFAYLVGYLSKTLADRGVKNNFVAILKGMYEREFDERHSLTLLNNIRDVRYKGVVIPEGVVSSKIRKLVAKYATAREFKQTLKLSVDLEYETAMYDIFQCVKIDASLLEEIMKLTPLGSVQSIVSKCTKNELFNCLMTAKAKHELLLKIREMDFSSISNTMTLMKNAVMDCTDEKFSVNDAFAYVYRLREEFYDAHRLDISNHTLMDPSFCLVHVPSDTPCTVKVNFKDIKPTTSDEMSSTWSYNPNKNYANMYDGRTINGIYPGTLIQGVMTSGFNSTKDLNPIRKAICNAACLAAYSTSKNNDGGALFSTVAASWGAVNLNIAPKVSKTMDTTASTKRLGQSLSSTSNQIVCYPNCNSLVEVDATSFGRYMDDRSIHCNYMSVVVCAKVSGLLEYATRREKPSSYSYNLTIGSEAATDDQIFLIREGADDDFEAALERISKCAPEVSREWFMTAMLKDFKSFDIPDGIAEEIKIIEVDSSIIPSGNLTDFIMPGDISKNQYSVVIKRSARRAQSGTDERYRNKHYSPKDKFRKLVDKYKLPEPNAAVCVAIEVAGIKGSKIVPEGLYTASRSDMHKFYKDVFKLMDPQEVLGIVNHVWDDPYIWKSRYVLEGLNKNMKRAICNMPMGRGVSDEDGVAFRKGACVALYSMYHGRLLSTHQYRCSSVYDPYFFRTTQLFAVKRSLGLALKTTTRSERIYREMCAFVYRKKAQVMKPYTKYSDLYQFMDSVFQASLNEVLKHDIPQITIIMFDPINDSDMRKDLEKKFGEHLLKVKKVHGVESIGTLDELYYEAMTDLAYYSFVHVRDIFDHKYQEMIKNEIVEIQADKKSMYSTAQLRYRPVDPEKGEESWYVRSIINYEKNRMDKSKANDTSSPCARAAATMFSELHHTDMSLDIGEIASTILDDHRDTMIPTEGRDKYDYCVYLYQALDCDAAYDVYHGKEPYNGEKADKSAFDKEDWTYLEGEFEDFLKERERQESKNTDER